MTRHELAALLDGYQDYGPIPAKSDPFGGTYLGDGAVITRLFSRHIVKTATGDMIVTPHLLAIGINEPHVTRFLISATRPGDVCVDVGANIGYFSVLMAWRAWPDGQVWSFEPQPDLYAMLSDNMFINGFDDMAHRRRLALSDHHGAADMRVFPGYQAASTLRAISPDFIRHTEAEKGRVSHSLSVEVAPLDDVMADVAAIDVLKIDAEGYEPAIIRGARQILARSPKPRVVMEFVPPIMGREPSLALLALLRDLGFSIFVLETDNSATRVDGDAALVDRPFSDLLLLKL